MAAKKKKITEEERYQMDLQLDADVQRLMKQQKQCEKERGGLTTGAKMARQTKLIRILEKEQNNVMTDLFVATCSTKKTDDALVTSNMQLLLHEYDHFDAHIKEKKNFLREIEEQIVMVKKKVVDARSKLISDFQYEAKVLNGHKSVESLENKLGTVVKRFCTVQSENNKLREEINHLLLERMTFNKLWEKLIVNLDKGKKFMIDIIEQATIAYNQRDECVSTLNALRSWAHNDLIMDTEEMIRLEHHTDDYSKLKKFLTVKGQVRNMAPLRTKETLKRKLRREAMEAHLLECKQILAEILEYSGSDTIHQFCRDYTELEVNNYSMFEFIALLNQDIEELTDGLVTNHANIDVQRNINQGRAQHQIDNLIKMKNDLAELTAEVNNAQAQLDATNATLAGIYKGVGKLFTICKCDIAPILQLLGDNTTINDYNVLLHLNLLENQITELILIVYYDENASKKAKTIVNENLMAGSVHLIEQVIPTNPCPLCVDQEMVSDVIDTRQYVQTREEVAGKLKLRLALPDGLERLHNVSACHLPKSRQIMQRRYQ